ncbi:MAG: 50S ribosomal protein L6 [Spirochaetaceae bacterium]|nr:MAG: 50S ribosomal protein L6 [Spirochaetaceae bacterium]
MSRIGKLPVTIPQGVTVTVAHDSVTVEGPKGTLSQSYVPLVEFTVGDGQCVVARKNDSKKARAFHGLYRKLLDNMVVGVSQGFSKTLLINGVGYRAEAQGKSVVFNLGYSMPIEYPIPEGLTITAEGPNKVTVSGISRERVGQVAAEIRSLRPPEPYKGKGVKYENEVIMRKVGKAGIK